MSPCCNETFLNKSFASSFVFSPLAPSCRVEPDTWYFVNGGDVDSRRLICISFSDHCVLIGSKSGL